MNSIDYGPKDIDRTTERKPIANADFGQYLIEACFDPKLGNDLFKGNPTVA